MIRLIQRRLIIPRGDTGSFTIPVIKPSNENIAVFTIFDETTHTKLFQKKVVCEGDVINIAFSHNDTVNLKPGKYLWDIKYYSNPLFVEDELVDGEEIDSYYAGYSLPACEIRPTGDDYLVSDDAPSATLAPAQLDIITNAITALNEAVEQTQTNVEHYPIIRDEIWYVWDVESNDYVSTGVDANGIAGNGIASAVLNNDYSLTLNFTDGTAFTSPSIRGETGNGIDDIVLNNDFTLTIIYTDGERYTTPSIRGPIGLTPQFSIGTVQEGAVAAASITGTAGNPVLNLTLPNANVPTRVSELENDSGYLTQHQDLSNYVQKTDYATLETAGVIKVNSSSTGLTITPNGTLRINPAELNQIKAGASGFQPLQPGYQHASTFYGLAKAAGDATQSQSSNEVGTYTNEAKAAIQQMLDVPSNADVAAKQNTLTFDNAPTANSTNPVTSGGVYNAIANINTMKIHICAQGEYNAETGVPTVQNPDTQTFYLVPGGEGSNLFIEWAYVNNAWERFGSADVEVPVQDVQINGASIVTNGVANIPKASASEFGVIKYISGSGLVMLGTGANKGALIIDGAPPDRIKPGAESLKPITPLYQHTSVFYGLAKAAGDSTQSASDNAVGTYTATAKTAIQTMLGVPGDVQINGASIVVNGVANVPIATSNSLGVVKTNSTYGTSISANGELAIAPAQSDSIKSGASGNKPLAPNRQHESVFYGLSKVAGVDLKNETITLGTYPETSKTAIRAMLGATSNNVIAVQDTQPTDSDTKIWLPETAEAPVQVPTVAEMNAALAGKVNDVQINGASIVSSGIANIPMITSTTPGIAKVDQYSLYGINVRADGTLQVVTASDAQVKSGSAGNDRRPITPSNQHASAFYGLAKAAGDTTQSQSDNAIGTYTDAAKTAIKAMIGVEEGLRVVRLI